MRLVWRYSFAFMGGFLAMSAHIYWVYGRGDWFSPPRLSNTLSAGLFFAHIFALMVIVARDVQIKSSLLQHLFRIFGGIVLGALTWFAHLFLILFQTNPHFQTLFLSGFALSFGFIVGGYFGQQSRLVQSAITMVLVAIAIYASIFVTHEAYNNDSSAQALLYFQADNPNDVYLIGLPFALTLAVIPNLPLLFNSSPRAEKK